MTKYVIGESVVISTNKKVGTIVEVKETENGVQYRVDTREGHVWVQPDYLKKFLTEVPEDGWGRETTLMMEADRDAKKD